ncbi:MAG: hypothetical protein LBR70_05570 [Lactobacillaceae bacterium]|jgi:hypothetical protein|nr:hypothetical protein [Lactobacillaceae bacterium]
MNDTKEKKIDIKEVTNISIIWAVLGLISSLSYIRGNYLIMLLSFLSPMIIYWIIVWKFGSGYLLHKITNLGFIKAIFGFFNKVLMIDNFEKSVINNSAQRKSRLFVISIITLFLIATVFSPLHFEVKLGILTIYIPLYYVAFKGYQLAFIALFAIKTIDIIALMTSKSNFLLGLVPFIVLSLIYLYALNTEDVRVTLENEGKKKPQEENPVRDTIIITGSYLVLFMLMVFAI